jgi:HK97 family phage prohead protease
MTVERKFIDLKSLKVSDEGPGSVEGYRAVFGEIDRQGDIVVKGAFLDSHDEYMRSGFSAESHVWNFKDAVGYPVDAYEDDYGWFVKSEFHTTQGAQDVRTIARERMKAGKQVGFSFGYSAEKYQFIEAKDFKDQLPQFIKADRLEENMKRAQQFSRIRILKKVDSIEDSLVTRPANPLTGATEVKSEAKNDPPVEAKGMFEDVLAQREESLYFLFDVFCSAIYSAQYLDEYGGAGIDLGAAVDEILSEFSARVRAAVIGDGSVEIASLRGPIDFKGSLRERLPFAKHAEAALGAVEVFAKRSAALFEMVSQLTERSKSIMELRESKAGAVYSGSNLSHMQRIHDAIGKVKKDVSSAHSDMAALIAKAKKPEKSDGQDLDVAALRTQSMRLEGDVLATLTH